MRHWARRVTCAAGLVVLCAAVSGCTTPSVGHDSFATGRRRVVELLNQTGAALPATAGFHRLKAGDIDREVCRKKFLGYSLGGRVARQPEATAIVNLPRRTDPDTMIPPIEADWRARGYRVDTSGLRDPKFPKVRAHVGDYTLVATSFSHTPGFSNAPRVTLYVVADCLRG